MEELTRVNGVRLADSPSAPAGIFVKELLHSFRLKRILVGSKPPLAFGDRAGYHSPICSPLDTPQGLGRGYFVSGGLDAR